MAVGPGAAWAEFWRVQIDKFLLAALVVYIYRTHGDSHLLMYILGGLTMLIQGRRFKT